MGERKGQNKYYPPDFDPQKHRSLDNYHGTHPLRNQAKKIHLGILEIRFEMPYNIWCGGCGIHIAMGVRYNADKTKIGMYYTTPIYQFRMRCHLCPNYIVIKTEPKTHEYVITEGARRKEQRWDPKENGQIETDDKDMQKKMAADAMFNLEHAADDRFKVKAAKPRLQRLQDEQHERRDDYTDNRRLRDTCRKRKKELKDIKEADDALRLKSCLDIDLVQETEDDIRTAHLMHRYKTVKKQTIEEKQENIMNSSIFNSPPSGTPSAGDNKPGTSFMGNPSKKPKLEPSLHLKSLVVKKSRKSSDNPRPSSPTPSLTTNPRSRDRSASNTPATSEYVSRPSSSDDCTPSIPSTALCDAGRPADSSQPESSASTQRLEPPCSTAATCTSSTTTSTYSSATNNSTTPSSTNASTPTSIPTKATQVLELPHLAYTPPPTSIHESPVSTPTITTTALVHPPTTAPTPLVTTGTVSHAPFSLLCNYSSSSNDSD